MTTIAANRTCMAADSKVTDGDISYRADKIFAIRSDLVGVAGGTDATNMFLDWYMAGKKTPGPELPKKSDFCALVLTRTGLFYYSACCPPDALLEDFYAIGTGSMAALAAMTLGHPPEVAVEVACQISPGSGGPVKVLSLPTPSLGTKYRKRRPKI